MLALVAASASARELVNVRLEFTAPAGCSDRETFAAGLRSRSEHIQIVESSDRGWIVSVGLMPKERRVHGELRLTDEHGESELRAVEGGDCAEVVEALSLTAALAIEQTVAKAKASTATGEGGAPPTSGATGGAFVAGGASPTSTATISTKPEDEPLRPPSEPRDDTAWDRGHVGVGAFVTERIASKTSFGVSLAVGTRLELAQGWAPEFTLRALYVPRDTLQPKGEIGVRYLGAGLALCPLSWDLNAKVSLIPCAVLEVGRLTVAERLVDVSSPSSRLTGFLGALGQGRVRLARHLELEVGFGIATPLGTRRYLAYVPSREVGHTAPLAWQADVGWLFGW